MLNYRIITEHYTETIMASRYMYDNLCCLRGTVLGFTMLISCLLILKRNPVIRGNNVSQACQCSCLLSLEVYQRKVVVKYPIMEGVTQEVWTRKFSF